MEAAWKNAGRLEKMEAAQKKMEAPQNKMRAAQKRPRPWDKKCGPLRKIPGPGTKKCGPLMKKCGPLMKNCGPPGSSLWHCSKCRCRKCSVLALARACSPCPLCRNVAVPGKSQTPEAAILHPLPLVLRAYASAWRVASCALCRRAAVRLKNTADRCFSAVLFCRLKKKS